MSEVDAAEGRRFTGYAGVRETGTDPDLTRVGRGTPGGEYLRRFWHPIAFVSELSAVPLRARILGEDLVIFRDGAGAIGVLHLNCCHRGASLEFGIVAEKGIRCCYHGRVFDTDGTILDMPGEAHADRLRQTQRQPAYPTHIFAGMIFVYMGPPEQKPPFPLYDRFDLPRVKLAPSMRQPFACNWVQIKDNAADPAHTAVLHAIKGANQFSEEFGHFRADFRRDAGRLVLFRGAPRRRQYLGALERRDHAEYPLAALDRRGRSQPQAVLATLAHHLDRAG
ncbi:MAG TPA: Rieske 2Fe-2S domain-containing protein [Stellaceae bacterium]|nr:Rieske 2Fe-2S domain-containing protein [Stellaceae bacterium]